MYGFVMLEQRKALHLTKADKRVVFGTFVGIDLQKHTFLNATIGKIWSQGIAVIDERSVIKAAPRASFEHVRDELLQLASGESQIFSFQKGEVIGQLGDMIDVPDSTNQVDESAKPVSSGQSEAPISSRTRKKACDDLTRGASDSEAPVSHSPSAVIVDTPESDEPQVPSKHTPESDEPQLSSKPKVMIPRELWSSMPCNEFGGAGWLGELTALCEKKGVCRVRCVVARDVEGQPFASMWLRVQDVEMLKSDGTPSGLDVTGASRSSLHLSAVSITSTVTIEPSTISEIERACDHAQGQLLCERDLFSLARSWAEVQDNRVAMHVAAASASKTKQTLIQVRGEPAWFTEPQTQNQAYRTPQASFWRQAEEVFIDKTQGQANGEAFTPIPCDSPELENQRLYRLLWAYRLKQADDGPSFHARLCFDATSVKGGFVDELTFAEVAQPMVSPTAHSFIWDV